jgi:hypothetical protein
MDNIEVKTIMQLVDQYWSTMMRCWLAQDRIMDESLSTEDRLKSAIVAQEQNALRTELIKVLDNRLGSKGVTNTSKTYFEENK